MDMNQKLDEKQVRFQSENTSNRLGHIASNLARLRTFCNTAYPEAVKSVANETICFIEWTAAETSLETAEELVELQIQLAIRQRSLHSIWDSEDRRNEIASFSASWSDRILKRSGLLNQ